MFRIRRYRVYVAIAALALFLLYHLTQDSGWDALPTTLDFKPIPRKPNFEPGSANPVINTDGDTNVGSYGMQQKRPKDPPKAPQEGVQDPVKIPELRTIIEDSGDDVDYNLPTITEISPKPTPARDSKVEETPSGAEAPKVIIPDRKTPHKLWQEQEEKEKEEELERLNGQKAVDEEQATVPISKPTIHWTRPKEHFPIASDSIIALPTGKPKPIPKIQYQFKEEASDIRERRETRLAKVKAEMVRAWTGYRTHAWMHDELSPVSDKFRDPFCGWAATLVDALDTLWIMGMKAEFEEAVEAIATIDFTTTPRAQIPVFETTIRYLGGLLGAYDVSGSKYPVLLTKAVELAEILMGVFDTPNRMPLLYFSWQPVSTTLPHSADPAASVAELGSLAMEFTRLAQLTKENKYYDAVARITDAFYHWQTRPNGTTIPGIFPERIDATGCNKTAARDAQLKLDADQKAKVQSVLTPPSGLVSEGEESLQNSPVFHPKVAGSGHRGAINNMATKDPLVASVDETGSTSDPNVLGRRDLVEQAGEEEEDAHDRPLTAKKGSSYTAEKPDLPTVSSPPDVYQRIATENIHSDPFAIPELNPNALCYPQGLASSGWGMDSYSMGGSQDSTYEYFPKQFLLLGALEPKYRDMHLKVADAVKKWMLYRPMVPDDRDILFSAKIMTKGEPEKDLLSEYEVTHLTCFLGGMFGMAGKIFEDRVDVEIGKKLTEGCVWAYESMPTGIMPEGATVVPCDSVTNCHWNETLWWQYLDPIWNTRDKQVADYEKRKEELKRAKFLEKESVKKQQDEAEQLEALQSQQKLTQVPKTVSHDESVVGTDASTIVADSSTEAIVGSPPEIRKRALIDPSTKEPEQQLETSSNDNIRPTETTKETIYDDLIAANRAGGKVIGKPASPGGIDGIGQHPLHGTDDEEEDATKPDPNRPLTHMEYINHRVKDEKIPPGYVNVNSRHYILRPEAIESVWYMYRITGDTTWQDKGWRMFESIIAMTQTESGHSAIQDVMDSTSIKSDEMESFWLAETLKYFYLLYAEPDVISLDEWVLNTEAHPFLRPKPE